MKNDQRPAVLRAIDNARNGVGFAIVSVITVALLVAGDTLARLVSIVPLAYCAWVGASFAREAHRRRTR
jgi:phage gp37-like protein